MGVSEEEYEVACAQAASSALASSTAPNDKAAGRGRERNIVVWLRISDAFRRR
jgi:hypothetical protein